MPIIRSVDSVIVQNLSEAEKQLGVDLKLNEDNDLELNNLNDIKLVAGGANAAQAVKVRLGIEPGGLLFHPEIGTDLLIGEKTKNAFFLKTQIIRSLTKDVRFSNIDCNVTVSGDVVVVDLRVTLKNTGIEVPLQFAVPN